MISRFLFQLVATDCLICDKLPSWGTFMSYLLGAVVAGVLAGVRPRSKVASDCTSAPDPRPAGSTLAPDPRAAGGTWGVETGKEDSVLFL